MTRKVMKKATKNLHGQLTPMGQSQTQKLELNKIKITYQNNPYCKETQYTAKKSKCLTRTRISEIRVTQVYGIFL